MVRGAFLLLLLVSRTFGDGVTATGRVPLRPPDGIYDVKGWLEGPSRVEMVRNILGARETGRAAVFVVILENRPDQVDEVAGRWGEKWGKGGLWGMVLHVPGEPGFPRYYGELSREPAWGKEVKRAFDESLAGALAEVSAKADLLTEERQRVEMAARVMAEGLGYLGVVMARNDHRHAQARGKPANESPPMEEEQRESSWWWQMVLPFFFLLVVILVFLVFRESGEEPPDDFLFPETEPRKRFRAPWAGGGNVLVEFGREKRERGR